MLPVEIVLVSKGMLPVRIVWDNHGHVTCKDFLVQARACYQYGLFGLSKGMLPVEIVWASKGMLPVEIVWCHARACYP